MFILNVCRSTFVVQRSRIVRFFPAKIFTSKMRVFFPPKCLGTKWTFNTLPTLQNNEPVPQVLKQVVNLSCYLSFLEALLLTAIGLCSVHIFYCCIVLGRLDLKFNLWLWKSSNFKFNLGNQVWLKFSISILEYDLSSKIGLSSQA